VARARAEGEADRAGMSLTQVAKKHRISRASVCKLVREANEKALPVLAGNDGLQAHAAGVAQ
jgi:transposase